MREKRSSLTSPGFADDLNVLVLALPMGSMSMAVLTHNVALFSLLNDGLQRCRPNFAEGELLQSRLAMVEVKEANKGSVRFVNCAYWGPCNQIARIAGAGTVGFSDFSCGVIMHVNPQPSAQNS